MLDTIGGGGIVVSVPRDKIDLEAVFRSLAMVDKPLCGSAHADVYGDNISKYDRAIKRQYTTSPSSATVESSDGSSLRVGKAERMASVKRRRITSPNHERTVFSPSSIKSRPSLSKTAGSGSTIQLREGNEKRVEESAGVLPTMNPRKRKSSWCWSTPSHSSSGVSRSSSTSSSSSGTEAEYEVAGVQRTARHHCQKQEPLKDSDGGGAVQPTRASCEMAVESTTVSRKVMKRKRSPSTPPTRPLSRFKVPITGTQRRPEIQKRSRKTKSTVEVEPKGNPHVDDLDDTISILNEVILDTAEEEGGQKVTSMQRRVTNRTPTDKPAVEDQSDTDGDDSKSSSSSSSDTTVPSVRTSKSPRVIKSNEASAESGTSGTTHSLVEKPSKVPPDNDDSESSSSSSPSSTSATTSRSSRSSHSKTKNATTSPRPGKEDAAATNRRLKITIHASEKNRESETSFTGPLRRVNVDKPEFVPPATTVNTKDPRLKRRVTVVPSENKNTDTDPVVAIGQERCREWINQQISMATSHYDKFENVSTLQRKIDTGVPRRRVEVTKRRQSVDSEIPKKRVDIKRRCSVGPTDRFKRAATPQRPLEHHRSATPHRGQYRCVDENYRVWTEHLRSVVTAPNTRGCLFLDAYLDGGLCRAFAVATANIFCDGTGLAYDFVKRKSSTSYVSDRLGDLVQPTDIIRFSLSNTEFSSVPVLVSCNFEDLLRTSSEAPTPFLEEFCRLKQLEADRQPAGTLNNCIDCYPSVERRALYVTRFDEDPRLYCQAHARCRFQNGENLLLYLPVLVSINISYSNVWLSSSYWPYDCKSIDAWNPIVSMRNKYPWVDYYNPADLLVHMARSVGMKSTTFRNCLSVVRSVQHICKELSLHRHSSRAEDLGQRTRHSYYYHHKRDRSSMVRRRR